MQYCHILAGSREIEGELRELGELGCILGEFYSTFRYRPFNLLNTRNTKKKPNPSAKCKLSILNQTEN